MFENLAQAFATGGFDAGQSMLPDSMGENHIAELYKALTAGSGVTDVASLTGGGALRIQSLDQTLFAVMATQKDFRLWNILDKTPARATIDEYTIQSSFGGYPGSSFNDELGTLNEYTSELARKVLQIKYLMTKRSVSFVKQLEGGIADPQALEQASGALQLLQDAEWSLFYGDSSVVPQEIDGLIKLQNDLASSNIVDLGGQPIGNSAEELVDACRLVSDRKNWGSASHCFLSSAVQGDMDKGLDPAVRVGVQQVPGTDSIGILKGNPVVGIKSSFAFDGKLQILYDKFIEESDAPAEAGVTVSNYASALNTSVVTPATLTGTPANDAASKFGATHAGNYYYGVEAVNKNGRSACTLSASITVSSGDKVTLTITAGSTPTETGYIVYRSRKNGSNAKTDLRRIGKVGKAGATTPFVDYNKSIPGTSTAFILNLSPGHNALGVRRMLPMMKFPLYPTNQITLQWAQLMFFALRNTKPQQHAQLINILPRTAVWRPFN